MTRSVPRTYNYNVPCDSANTENDDEAIPDFETAITTATVTTTTDTNTNIAMTNTTPYINGANSAPTAVVTTTIPRTARRARPVTHKMTRASYNYEEWKCEFDRRPHTSATGIYCTDTDPFDSESTESD